MTIVYFIRHAHSTYTPDELQRPLSEKGIKDALSVTEIMKIEEVDVVISSPYLRAIETVEGVAAYFKKEILLFDHLRERVLSSVPVDNFNYAMQQVWDNPDFAFEGGESNIVAQNRAIQTFLQMLTKYKDQKLVIGTHGNIFTLIMNYFDSYYDFYFWQKLQMPDIYKCTFQGYELIHVEKIWKAVRE